jgi:hypothetical protein
LVKLIVGTERVVKLKVGCHPEAAVSGGLLLQSESAVFLLFNAMSDEENAQGSPEDLGRAVIQFKGCRCTKFGDPNDEALDEHPLYDKGLDESVYGISEVMNSTWAHEVTGRAKASAMRIWGERFERAYENVDWSCRHFIVSFHDSTFECLADDFELTLHKEPFGEVLQGIYQRL